MGQRVHQWAGSLARLIPAGPLPPPHSGPSALRPARSPPAPPQPTRPSTGCFGDDGTFALLRINYKRAE